MNIIEFSVRRPVTITMIFVATVLFGFVALDRLSIRLLPEVNYPTLTIQTEYPDAAPAEVENFVTRPLEEAVGVVNGLRSIRSSSKPGLSEITLQFSWKSEMQYSALDVRDKIDLVQLPRECDEPVILRYDPALDPVIRVGVYGPENLVRLRYVCDQVVKKELESVDGVASAKVLGGLEEEIQVEVDERRLASYGIPIGEISTRLTQENVNQSGGRIRDKGSEFLLRTENEFQGVDEIAATIVRENEGKRVVLADLGNVERGYMEREIVTRLNGREMVEVAVYKEGDANTVEVAQSIKDRIELLGSIVPPDTKLELLFDQSRFIEKSIGEVRSNALLGALLATIVLFVFLRDGRSTFIIALSIPISIMATFMMMHRLNVSLNLMSLGGLALGVGMLVDNSIVVLENISRHKEKGLDRAAATIAGAKEVSRAVIASTLTTVSVFLPIVFVEGIAGQVFKDQALTVSVSLLASLIVSLMLIPMVSALKFNVAVPEPVASETPEPVAPKKRRKIFMPFRVIGRGLAVVRRVLFQIVPLFFLRIGRWCVRMLGKLGTLITNPFLRVFNALFGAVERGYEPILRRVLAARGGFLTAVLVLFAVSVWSGQFLGRELIPQFSQGEFSFSVELPEGSPLESTDDKLLQMEEIAASDPDVGLYFSTVGTANRLGSNAKSRDKHIGQLNVVMAEKGQPAREDELVNRLRNKFAAVQGMDFKFSRPTFFSVQTPVEVHVFGYNLDILKDTADDIARRMTDIPGVADVKTSLEYGNPEVNINFDRVRLSSLNLTLDQVANTVRAKIRGDVPTVYKEREKQIDIRVRSAAWRSSDLEDIRNIVVGEHEGRPILLSTVADVGVARGLNQISRVSQQRAAVISANVSGADLGSVAGEVQAMIGGMEIPREVNVEVAGQNEELLDSYRNLQLALLLAIFLVYLVMAAQFESFLHPFIILFTVPLGAIGVVATLLLFGKSISVVVFIGAIMLAGIVVNNGIVLIDYINGLRAEGMKKTAAIIEASKIRLRPILMTTLTTVLGLLPMALGLGEGAEIRSPMALTVIGGLLGGTVLTLLVIPSLYSIVARGE